MRYSATMLEALRRIVAEYDVAAQQERQRWGERSAASLAAKGIDVAGLSRDYRTVHALVDRGALTMTAEPRTFGETLRKGSWGHRLGGTKQHRYVQIVVVPTERGRKVIEESSK
jgi:hypothetical protein